MSEATFRQLQAEWQYSHLNYPDDPSKFLGNALNIQQLYWEATSKIRMHQLSKMSLLPEKALATFSCSTVVLFVKKHLRLLISRSICRCFH